MKFRHLFRSCLVIALVSVGVGAQNRPQIGLDSSTQLLVVTTPDWNSIEGKLQRYERPSVRKLWKPVGESITVVVGKDGVGWDKSLPISSGTDSNGVRAASDPVKKEGDGRAPAGIFSLTTAFGYAAERPPGWKMPYLNLTSSTECVDDVGSKSYNRVLDRSGVVPDWNSSEHMLRPDELYRWGVVVAYNSGPPQPGDGSCIFLHIWRGPGIPTVGCTAMPQEQIESLLAWLDPARKPLLVQLPVPEYRKLRKRWKLPDLRLTTKPDPS